MKSYSLPDGSEKYDAVILADGSYPSDDSIAGSILAAADYVVCCDGAADEYVARGGMPAAIAGDCDSLSEGTVRRYKDRIHPSADQETNDLTKAFMFCFGQRRKNIAILGATGKREDHTIANVSLLVNYAEKTDVIMVTDYGVFNAIREDSVFRSFRGQQVSIFTIGTDIPVSVDGLLYIPPADGLPGWWRGSLNESAGDEFTIFTPGPAIIYRNFLR